MKHLIIIVCSSLLAYFNLTAQTVSPQELPTWKWVIEPKFDMAAPFYEGFTAIRKQRKWGFIDKTGDFVIPPQFESVKQFSDGMAAIRQNGKWGYINHKGEIVIPPKYYNVYNFTDDIARVERYANDKDYYINRNGHLTPILPPDIKKSKGKTPTNRTAFPSIDRGKYGFKDKKNNWIVLPQFNVAKDFSDSVACVQLNGKWGYIVIATPYESVSLYIQNSIKQAKHTDLAAELANLFYAAMDSFKDSPLFITDMAQAELQDYDTVHNTYKIITPTFGELVISVEKEDAVSLKSNWSKIKYTEATFDKVKNIKTGNPEIILTSVNVVNTANDKIYKWDYSVTHQYMDDINTYYYDYISLLEAFGEGLLIDEVNEDELKMRIKPRTGVIVEPEIEVEKIEIEKDSNNTVDESE